MIYLRDAAGPVRAALDRLAETPRELRCYVIIEDRVTGRFVQFCTPPPRSRFGDGPPLAFTKEPLIFDGTGDGKRGGYVYIQVPCDVARGVELALGALAVSLPPEAELRIIEEATHRERPS